MINHHGAWLPSVKIGLPILILAGIALALAVAICIHTLIGWKPKNTYDDRVVWYLGITLSGMALTGVLLGAGFGYWPYHGDYHRLQPIAGTVQAVDSRFLAASQYVVVTYTGGTVVRCDDSRCATIKPGEQLRLLCTKEHQFGSPLAADGWGCRWGEGNQ